MCECVWKTWTRMTARNKKKERARRWWTDLLNLLHLAPTYAPNTQYSHSSLHSHRVHSCLHTHTNLRREDNYRKSSVVSTFLRSLLFSSSLRVAFFRLVKVYLYTFVSENCRSRRNSHNSTLFGRLHKRDVSIRTWNQVCTHKYRKYPHLSACATIAYSLWP